MYCPSCGIQNLTDEVKFCRGCGADLRLASQALQGRLGWPSFLANRLDNLLSGRYRQNARDGGINIFIGLVCVMLAVYYMLTGQGALIFWVVVSLSALLGIGVGVYDVLIYRRGVRGFPRDVDRVPGDLSIFKGDEKSLPPARRGAFDPAGEMLTPKTTAAIAPPSVTEDTTRRFEADRGPEGGAG